MPWFRTIFALWLLSGVGRAQSNGIDEPSIVHQADVYLNDLVKEDRFSGTVLLARNGKIVLSKGYGLANRETGTSNSPQTKIRLGSLTKQFTAVAILMLQEEGKLNVQDPISKYLQNSPPEWKPITIHHLLTHSSGIPSYTRFPDFRKLAVNRATPLDLINRFRDKPLEFPPGKEFDYSNSGYILLGYIIEQLSGQPYAEFLRERIFDRLGLKDSGYDQYDVILGNRAEGYTPARNGIRRAPYIDMTVPFAAGGLYSTSEDLYRWSKTLFGNELLSQKSREAMMTPYQGGYGYGLFVKEQYGLRNISHGGGIEGASTLLSIFPNENATVIVLSNIDNVFTHGYAKRLAGILLEDKVSLPKVVPRPVAELRQYEGRYQIAEKAATEDIFIRNGKLRVKISGGDARFLEPVGGDDFVVSEDFEARYHFNRDEKGELGSCTFKLGKMEYVLKRLAIPAPSLTGNTTFQLKGYENARYVNLAGTFNDWKPSTIFLGRENGQWVGRIDLKPGKYSYKFIIDGDWTKDPLNSQIEEDEHGDTSSVRVVAEKP